MTGNDKYMVQAINWEMTKDFARDYEAFMVVINGGKINGRP